MAAEHRFLDDYIVYRPDLEEKPSDLLGVTLSTWVPKILFCRRPPATEVLRRWRDAAADVHLCVVALSGDDKDHERLRAHDVSLHVIQAESLDDAVAEGIALAERLITCHVTARANQAVLETARARSTTRTSSVTLVGAGIVNTLTGYYLQRAGYAVTVVDAGPDPRTRPPWRQLGCTSGGDDARMFTLSEADDYHHQGDEFDADMNALFRRTPHAGGWLTTQPEQLDRGDRRWIADFEHVPPWLARRYNRDIFAFNRESQGLWDELVEGSPGLFEDVEYRPDILRLYSDPDHYCSAIERQRRIGALRRVLPADEVAASHPALAQAVAGEQIAGGVEVVGFTVNVHKFMSKLHGALERGGAVFHWDTRATEVQRDPGGAVRGVAAGDRVFTSDHYVLSPGVYGNELLRGFRSHDRIHGVLGLWLRVPNLEPKLEHSLKIGRKGHMAEDANVTVATDADGNDILIIGSGYGYTGLDPANIDSDLLAELFDAVEDTAARFFPAACAQARAAGTLQASRKLCVRPWTASNLGVFELAPAEHGGAFVITGGHNTGGFAHAPAVARAVQCALRGEHHDMHDHYHPDRLDGFYGLRRARGCR
ncbi:NAD(P)/FAD-dependent oxidoreductase [Haliangium sp.]|uniref:NAD(P)/FAD-dependent oxidoreductase n=1 Tax=Haliangium sp. TaxID=2663208 RepID=UPI003D112C49